MKTIPAVALLMVVICTEGVCRAQQEPADDGTSPGVWAVTGIEAGMILAGGTTYWLTGGDDDWTAGSMVLSAIAGGVGLGVGSAYGGWDDRIAYGISGGLWGATEGMLLGSLLVHTIGSETLGFGWASVVGAMALGGLSSWAQVALSDDWEDWVWTAVSHACGALGGGLVMGMYALTTSFSCSSGRPDCNAERDNPERTMLWILLTSTMLGHATGLLITGLRQPDSEGSVGQQPWPALGLSASPDGGELVFTMGWSW